MKKKNYLRLCVGIDVSNERIDVAISAIDDLIVLHVLATTHFENTPSGHVKLEDWIERKRIKDVPLQVVMEATGIYHERLAYHLVNDGYELAIVMPNRIKSYCNSTSIRSVTDKISAKQIAEFGLLKRPTNWQKPQPVIRNLKLLTREKNCLLEERTAVNNQMHAYDKRYSEDKSAINRSLKRIQMIDDHLREIEKEIKTIIKKKENAWLDEKIRKICTVPGLGFTTVISVVAETDAFSLFHSSRQLVCYSGYDVVFKESGTSVKKKTRISHRGNKYIRKALFFPALTAKMHDPNMSAFYERLFDRQQVKMQAYTAIQRKLLVLIYTLWKKDETYNPNFVWTGKAETGSGGNQPVRNSLSDWNGPREG
jgi:transposase